MIIAVSLCIALTWLAAPMVAQAADDWSKSAEASLMTRDERRAWQRLGTAAAREEFKRAYWQRRDPTPETDRNEFQEEIFARVGRADERFGSSNVAGSRTARGLVFVVLGPPAVVRGTSGPLDTAPRTEFPSRSTLPRAALDTTTWEEWVYEGEHNRELLKILGRPFVQLAFVVERGRDQLQRPGVFDHYRETVARRSIVRP